MRRGWKFALAAAAALSLATRAATADELRIGASTVEVHIVADAAAGCPTEAAFRDAIRAAVTAPAASDATDALPPTHFKVLITADRDGATSTLTSRSDGSTATQQRTVRGATCRQVAEAIALVVVLSIDPLAGPIHLPLVPPPSPTETPSPPPSQPAKAPSLEPTRAKTDEAPAPATERSPHRAVQIGAAATGGAIVGLLPGVAPLVEGTLVVQWPTPLPVELRIGAGAFLPDDRAFSGGVVDFWGVRARGGICPAWRTSVRGARLTMGACGGPTFDWIFTHAHGFTRTTTTGVCVPSLTTGVFAGYDFGAARRWSIGLDADLGFVLVATSWTVLSVGQVQHTSPVTGRLGAFLRVNFP